jgi:hypothetical protein
VKIGIDPAGFHAEYRELIPTVLEPLIARWPGAIKEVRAYRGEPDDRSLGYEQGGQICLNRFWFGRPIEVLRAADTRGREISKSPGVASFHGQMAEPEHVLVHEFSHGVRVLIGDAALRFARDGFADAIIDPRLAVTQYALADPEEWFAETFTAGQIGAAAERANEQVGALLKWLEEDLPRC